MIDALPITGRCLPRGGAAIVFLSTDRRIVPLCESKEATQPSLVNSCPFIAVRKPWSSWRMNGAGMPYRPRFLSLGGSRGHLTWPVCRKHALPPLQGISLLFRIHPSLLRGRTHMQAATKDCSSCPGKRSCSGRSHIPLRMAPLRWIAPLRREEGSKVTRTSTRVERLR